MKRQIGFEMNSVWIYEGKSSNFIFCGLGQQLDLAGGIKSLALIIRISIISFKCKSRINANFSMKFCVHLSSKPNFHFLSSPSTFLIQCHLLVANIILLKRIT